MELTYLEGNQTLLSGPLPDQAALHGLLERIRDLNPTLLSVTYRGPSTPSDGATNRRPAYGKLLHGLGRPRTTNVVGHLR